MPPKRKLGATAVASMTDNIAVGAYRAARTAGLSVPKDLSVVGFNDAPFVGDLTPGLTTIRPPFYEVGVLSRPGSRWVSPPRKVLYCGRNSCAAGPRPPRPRRSNP